MKILLFGCGQGGQMAAKWLPASTKLLAFSDNDPQKWGNFLSGVPVIAPAEIPKHEPDLVLIAIRNADAARLVQTQLVDLGYRGAVRTLAFFRDIMDLRLAQFRLLAEEIRRLKLPGAVAELGVYRGDFAAEINRLFPERTLYLFDTFAGFTQQDLDAEPARNQAGQAAVGDFGDTDPRLVLSRLPHPQQAVLCPGRFPDTLPPDLPPLAFVSLDPDLYEPTRQGLRAFWPHLVPGGILLIHDYNSAQFSGPHRAVREFCDTEYLLPIPLPDLHGSAILQKPLHL